jgi:hypothetical protein
MVQKGVLFVSDGSEETHRTDYQTRPARVVRLITDDELVFNLGAVNGVRTGMLFNVIDPATEDILDPQTGENLGSIKRKKAQIRVIDVSPRISLARVYPSRGRAGFSRDADTLMGPKPPSATLSGESWPDGVRVGDPVEFSAERVDVRRQIG